MKAIGLMSGTSLDGVTIVLISSDTEGNNFKVLAEETTSYDAIVRESLRALEEGGTTHDVALYNMYLGRLYGECAASFMRKQGLTKNDVSVIALHGQTIYHHPDQELVVDSPVAYTLQIGEPSFIAESTGVPVVSNFRTRDMAAGGQGAPLIPFFDYLMFHRLGHVAVVNLGGIGNVTGVYDSLDQVVAFDTGPCNMILDRAIQLLTNDRFTYDRDGDCALKGHHNEELLRWLRTSDSFVQWLPPKSVGRTTYGTSFVQAFLEQSRNRKLDIEDVLATLNRHVAWTIAYSLQSYLRPVNRVIVGGGGVCNAAIMHNLADLTGVPVTRCDDYGIPYEAKEGAAFALYGLRTMAGLPSNVPSATGASHAVVLGQITPANV